MKKGLMFLLCIAAFFTFNGCSKKEEQTVSSSKAKKEEINKEKEPGAVVFWGAYWTISADGVPVVFENVIPGSGVETIKVNGAVETKTVSDLEGGSKTFVHVKLDDEEVWIEEQKSVVNADAGYILETGTDIYLYEKPDVDAKRVTKLNFDTIVASLGKCKESTEFKEAQKFYQVKVPTEKEGEYLDGFVRSSNIDFSPVYLAYIQVSKKYNQLVNSGTASAEVLDELEDTMKDLSSWGGR